MNIAPAPLAESIHLSLWRASQLARGRQSTVDTGYPALSQELPGGGWPIGALVEVLSEQPGSGEIRLLVPALGAIKQPVALEEHFWLPAGANETRFLKAIVDGQDRISAAVERKMLRARDELIRLDKGDFSH
jgi:hypothetical protein